MTEIEDLRAALRTAEAERDQAARHAREAAIADALVHVERHWLGHLDGALAALRALAPAPSRIVETAESTVDQAERIVGRKLSYLSYLSKRDDWAEDDTAVGAWAAHIVQALADAGLLAKPSVETAEEWESVTEEWWVLGHPGWPSGYDARTRENAERFYWEYPKLDRTHDGVRIVRKRIERFAEYQPVPPTPETEENDRG